MELTKKFVSDFCLVILILFAGMIYTSGISQYLDIWLYDESNYLASGLAVPKGLPSSENAPIYAIWYYLLSLFRNDSIELYFLNYRAMTVLPAVAFFLAARLSGVPRIFSIAFALGLLVSSAIFPIGPKVAHFALLLLLIGFFLAGFTKEIRVKISLLLITSLAASYARPEYFLSVIVFGVFLIAHVLHQAKNEGIKKFLPFSAFLAIFLSFTILNFGLPIGGGDRSMVAFGQHYSLNWVRWNNDERNPWTNYKTITKIDFGDANSVSSAIFSNPHAFSMHLLTNLDSLPKEILSTFVSSYPAGRWGRAGTALGISIIILAMILYAWRSESKNNDKGSWLRRRIHKTWFEVLAVLILLLPGIISFLIIYPRSHYIMISGVLTAFAVIIFITKDEDLDSDQNIPLPLLISGIALLLIRPISLPPGSGAQPNIKTIEFLRALDINIPINILEAEGGYGIYVGDNYKRVAEYSKKAPWSIFIEENEINMIILSESLKKDVRFINDHEWQDFLENPTAWGFNYQEIPNVENRKLLYRAGIVE